MKKPHEYCGVMADLLNGNVMTGRSRSGAEPLMVYLPHLGERVELTLDELVTFLTNRYAVTEDEPLLTLFVFLYNRDRDRKRRTDAALKKRAGGSKRSTTGKKSEAHDLPEGLTLEMLPAGCPGWGKYSMDLMTCGLCRVNLECLSVGYLSSKDAKTPV